MKKVCFFFLFISLSFCVTVVQGQTRKVTGRVISDSSLQGLAGVSVILRGGNGATTTDNEGRFTINVPEKGNHVLEFSSVGYSDREVPIGNRSTLDVTLATATSDLNEVVVIGYQTVKRRDLTGTVSSISGKDLEKIPVSNVAEALTGRLPGVQVTTVDGQPGAEIIVRVRGGGSITGSNDPLFIVDGFRVSTINDIPASDIASIDILKDAATTAIYGAAGANGVVIVTTKSARGGKTAVSYNGFVQGRELPHKLKVLSPYEFVLAQYEYARLRSQTDVDNFTKYFGAYEDLELYKYQEGTDWQEKLYGDLSYSQQHSVSVTGGSDKTKISLNYTSNSDIGLLPINNYHRNYINFKLNHEISNSIKLDVGARYTHTIINGAGSSGTANFRISDGITTRPVNGLADNIIIDPGASADDYEQFIVNMINPIELTKQDYRKRVGRVFNLNAGATWSITKNIIYRTEFGYGLSYGNNRRYFGPLTSTSRNEGGNLPLGEITQSQAQDLRFSNTLNYLLKAGGKHDLSVLLGQEVLLRGQGFEEYNRAKYFDAGITPQKLFATMGLGTQDIHNTNEIAADKTASFFGRLLYQYDNRYIFNVTARYDGSTRFAPGKQWGIFPAASVAWRISSEDFMENISFVNDLKFRASYGTVGNNNIGSDQWRMLFAPSNSRPYGAGDILNPYYNFASSQLSNPDIQWETTITRNLGLDFTLFNKLNGTLDFYHNTTKDLLVQSVIPQTTGFTSQQRNIGQTSNRGVELQLNANIVSKKDFQVSVNLNVGINRARIDKLDGVDERSFNSNWASTDLRTQDDYRLIVGRTVGLMYGYVSDGMYTVSDFESYDPVSRTYKLKAGVPTVALGGISLRPGVMKLKDLDGDGAISAEKDRKIIGSALPKAAGGFGFNTVYKGFDFMAFFNWVYGNDVYNTGRISFNMQYRTTYGNILDNSRFDRRFHYIDPNGNLVTGLDELGKLNPNPLVPTPFSMGTASPWFYSDAVEDGSFIRLNNISLGYSLPRKLISKFFMTKLRAYVTVYNAWLWTKYSGYDPEVSTSRNSGFNQLIPGVDYSAFPKSRSYTVGLNVTF